jgi:hypothetical protein
MTCKSCTVESKLEFGAEMIIHFPGWDGVDKPTVWVFPKLTVCMDCGSTEFNIPEAELALLANGIRVSKPTGSAGIGLGDAIELQSWGSKSGARPGIKN